jgi:hypothetical protein
MVKRSIARKTRVAIYIFCSHRFLARNSPRITLLASSVYSKIGGMKLDYWFAR